MKIKRINSNEAPANRTCAYCEQPIEIVIDSDVYRICVPDFDRSIYVHRNCVVAFATRILNEFEKL